MAACHTFGVRTGSRVYAGNREPFGWTWVARYHQPASGLNATSVALPSDVSRAFEGTSRPLFTSHGWTLVQRH
jgi:hypothetical protein